MLKYTLSIRGHWEIFNFLPEHLEAHDGSWQNPTNWYFNLVTKENIDFVDGPFIPCEIIQLSEPIISLRDNSNIKEIFIEKKRIQVRLRML